MSNVVFNEAYRYVDWLLTVPLLLVETVAVMALARAAQRSLLVKLIPAATAMIVLGYPGEVATTNTARIVWGIIATLPFLYIVYVLFVELSRSLDRQPVQVRRLTKLLPVMLVVLWCVYPIAYAFPIIGGDFFGGADGFVLRQVGYSVADILAKAAFGLLIFQVARIKSRIDDPAAYDDEFAVASAPATAGLVQRFREWFHRLRSAPHPGMTAPVLVRRPRARFPATRKASDLMNTIAMQEKPFYGLTLELLDSVRDHDYARLAALCDDDFGIVDITTTGGSLVIRDRAGWEEWFTGLFAQLDALRRERGRRSPATRPSVSGDMGYSVVDFDQTFIAEDEKLRFGVIATIIWKRVDGDVEGIPLPQLTGRGRKDLKPRSSLRRNRAGECDRGMTVHMDAATPAPGWRRLPDESRPQRHEREQSYSSAQASVNTDRRMDSISSNSCCPLISGGATCTTVSPRSSARQYSPRSNSAVETKSRRIRSLSSLLKVALVAWSLTSSMPKK